MDYDYGARIYGARVGKFMSVDPLQTKYPELTPYQFASNTPITAIDIDGLESNLKLNVIDNRKSNDRVMASMYGQSDEERADPRVYYAHCQDRAVLGMRKAAAVEACLAIIALDMYLTKGKLSRFFVGAVFASAFTDNRAKTVEGRIEQDRESMNHLIAAGTMWATGAMAERLFSVVNFVSDDIYARLGQLKNLAREILPGEDIP